MRDRAYAALRTLLPVKSLAVHTVNKHADALLTPPLWTGLSTDKASGYDKTMSTPCGTPDFTSPELLQCGARVKQVRRSRSGPQTGLGPYLGFIDRQDFVVLYSCKVDVWSAGAVMYCILSARPPFQGAAGDEGMARMVDKIMRGDYCFPASEWEDVSLAAMQCIGAMLQVYVCMYVCMYI